MGNTQDFFNQELADGAVVDPRAPYNQVRGPFAGIGRLSVQGEERTLSLTLTENFNGFIILPSPRLYKGKFTLKEDCTGTFEISLVNERGEVNKQVDAFFEFVVVDKGKEIQFMRMKYNYTPQDPIAATVITGVAKKQ